MSAALMAQPGLHSMAMAVSTKAKVKGKNRKRKKSTMAGGAYATPIAPQNHMDLHSHLRLLTSLITKKNMK